ncbi:MAG: DNA topoisomerase IV subunit A, partial [Rhizobiales bacterium]|nr:DNA topoisomerase IV subunit A [Hyphomicrobiales bacterium]
DQGRGTYVIVVTEIPYQVQKSRLIEKLAELVQTRRVPLLADVRDESAEDIRVVLEPRARTVDAALLMESLFKLSDLESRIPLNMNVLSKGLVPKVMSLGEVLREWLDHRREVLLRRSEFRLGQIRHRLEVLGGYIIAFLNLDEVIRIIREEDDPKAELMRTFELTDLQAESILNMRLRSLRKLEEMELRREHAALSEELAQIEALMASEPKQWQTVAWQIGEVRKTFGPDTPLGKRRTTFAEAPSHDAVDIEQSMIEREPITVIVSEKGWIRALKGHQVDLSTLTFKTDDQLKFSLQAETTDKLLVFSTGGKFFTLAADKLPGGRGHGEPVRLMVDMDNDQDVVAVFVHKPERRLLLTATDGRGFVVPESELVANTRKGKQILNVEAPDEARLCVAAKGDMVAIIGQNRKFLVFPLEQVPEMTRGKGVRLQRYRDGGPADMRVFSKADGLTWVDSSGRSYTRSMEELKDFVAERGQAGRLPPDKFPKSNQFGTPPLP